MGAGAHDLSNDSRYSRLNLGSSIGMEEHKVHDQRMWKGSKALLAALKGEPPKRSDLMWINRVSPATYITGDSPCHQLRTQFERIEARQAPYRNYEELRVYREPCPSCGVRADLHDEHGCGRKVLLP
jgi:hypothetical protein